MDAMESIKTEAREAINDELAHHRDGASWAHPAEWDEAVERIVARIESAADDMDPDPWAIGKSVEHAVFRGVYGLGVVIDRTETDGELHTVKVRWPDLSGAVEAYSPRELRAADR